MNSLNRAKNIDRWFFDLKGYIKEGRYEYASTLVRKIVETIINSYADYYAPDLKDTDLDEKLKKFEERGVFKEDQLNILHDMRKLGNKAVHHDVFGLTEEQYRIQLCGLLPRMENEIARWKKFANISDEYISDTGNNANSPQNVKSFLALFTSVISMAVIVILTLGFTKDFFVNGVSYSIDRIWVWHLCLIAFFVIASYCRPYGSLHKTIFNLGILYFLLPRIYQVFLCLSGKAGFFSLVIYFAIACGIIGIYSILVLHVDQKKGGIVGM